MIDRIDFLVDMVMISKWSFSAVALEEEER